jgi:hypothetical protein
MSVAFGSQSIRFNVNGLHPNLLTNGVMPYSGSTTNTTNVKLLSCYKLKIKNKFLKLKLKAGNLGPGSYDLLRYNEFSDNNVMRKADGPNWERSALTEKLAKMPHLLYQDSFKKKQEDVRELIVKYIINLSSLLFQLIEKEIGPRLL